MDENAPAPVTVADGEILTRRILPGIKIMREHLGCSLQAAFLAFHARYEVLRRERPEDFTLAPEEYWEGFSS
ncbi:hypothetical protein [Streptomyces sp. NPDC054961]